jgi:hypothetical protein
MRLRPGGERGALLMANVDPVDLALLSQRLRYPVETIAHEPIDTSDARLKQRAG